MCSYKILIVDPNYNYTERQLQSAFQPINNISFDQSDQSLTNQNDASSSSADLSQVQTNQVHDRTGSFIFDLKKYKHDRFLANLQCPFDANFGKFGAPYGITALPDDRLLVANFGSDSLLLFDLNGAVHQVYRPISMPKDVVYNSTNSSQAIVATRNKAILLDLETKQTVLQSTLKGFYPWNIQYLQEHNVFSACDPSGERIVFLDSNLKQVGEWSFNQPNLFSNQSYEKIYPYAACFFPDNRSFVLTHRGQICELKQCDSRTGGVIKTYPTPPGLLSYGMRGDEQNKCLIADTGNHSLLVVNPDETFEQYNFKSVREPHALTFLSDGTLCVTDRSKMSGTQGGIAVITELG